MKRHIYITTKIEGFHKYENAPDEVWYLRNTHRHLFGVKATIEVYHEDRELEFIMIKHQVDEMLKDILASSEDGVSCETIAEELYKRLKWFHGTTRAIQIEVNEDGENGVVLGDTI